MTVLALTTALALTAAAAAPSSSPVPSVASEGPSLALSATLTINVADPQAAGDALVDKAAALGGYFAERTDNAVVLKVPTEKADALITYVATLGTVLQRGRQADDLRVQLEQQRALLASKRAMLDQYLDVLHSAAVGAVVMVERQVTALVAEIESLEGAIAMLQHRLEMAVVRVTFQLERRRTPVPDGRSPFRWLNTVNLVDLYRDLAHAPE